MYSGELGLNHAAMFANTLLGGAKPATVVGKIITLEAKMIVSFVSPGDEANGLMHMPTGQSGHPLSKFYRKGHDEWVHGRPSPFLPGEPQHTLELVPAD